MAKTKKMNVEQMLHLVPQDEEVEIHFYAYGIWYASSWADGMKYSEECLKGLRYDCLEATVTAVLVGNPNKRLVIRAEICK